MAHVFISYVRDDQKLVDQLAADLKHAGVHVWVDREQIQPGLKWPDAIAAAIQEGGHFLACFSKAYHARDRSYMNEELTQAIEEIRKRRPGHPWLLPVCLDDCEVPTRSIGGGETLRDIQRVDMYGDWDRGIRDLLTVLDPAARARGEEQKAERMKGLKSFDWEHPVSKAILGIISKDPATRLSAAKELREIRDPATIPFLAKVISEEVGPTLTKVIAMAALRAFGERAVPTLIGQVREHAQLVHELENPPVDVDVQAWRAAVVESDAGRLLVAIGASAVPSLGELRKSEGLLGEAATALLRAIEKRHMLDAVVESKVMQGQES